MKIYLLFETDVWHSGMSKDLVGVSDSLSGLVEMAHKRALKVDGEKLNEEQVWNLINIGQTQGYMGDNIGEFDTQVETLNELF